MIKPIEIEKAKLVLFNKKELSTQPFKTWDDNGGEPDGDCYLLPLTNTIPFEGMEVVNGFIVHAYTESSNYRNWCGFSSHNVAYTTDEDTAVAIANDEYGILSSR